MTWPIASTTDCMSAEQAGPVNSPVPLVTTLTLVELDTELALAPPPPSSPAAGGFEALHAGATAAASGRSTSAGDDRCFIRPLGRRRRPPGAGYASFRGRRTRRHRTSRGRRSG